MSTNSFSLICACILYRYTLHILVSVNIYLNRIRTKLPRYVRTYWHIYHYKMVNAQTNRNSRRNILYYSLIWIFWRPISVWQWRRARPKIPSSIYNICPSLLLHLIPFHSFPFSLVSYVMCMSLLLLLLICWIRRSIFIFRHCIHRWIQLKQMITSCIDKEKRQRKKMPRKTWSEWGTKISEILYVFHRRNFCCSRARIRLPNELQTCKCVSLLQQYKS